MRKNLFLCFLTLTGTMALANQHESSSLILACVPITIDCGGGKTAVGDVCGDTTKDLVEASQILSEIACG